jgi:hypothetical protein
MSPYEQVRDLARQQAEAARRGDLDSAVDALDVRAALLADAPEPSPSDLVAIRETLALDRELSSAINGHMAAIRDETRDMQRGRTALTGYGSAVAQHSAYVDCDV